MARQGRVLSMLWLPRFLSVTDFRKSHLSIRGDSPNTYSSLERTPYLRVAIDRFLGGLQISGYTRNEYVGNIKAFTKWAVESKRLREDPLLSLKKSLRNKIKPVHPRRALSETEISKLIDAAVRRPLLEVATIRTGKNRGRRVALVNSRVLAKMQRIGRTRCLCYMIAVWTGLRRGEIKALTWGDIDLNLNAPVIRLRAETTKAKRGDVLVIHPQLRAEFETAKRDCLHPAQYVVHSVPDMKTFRADLKLAGIDEGNKEIGFVDFHSLRKTLSTRMAYAGMSQRSRQSHMRHTDPRLTEGTYIDERLLPIAAELAEIPYISVADLNDSTNGNTNDVHAVTVPGAVPGAVIAADLHRTTATLTLDLASGGTSPQEEMVELIVRGPLSQILQIQRIGQALTLNDKAGKRES